MARSKTEIMKMDLYGILEVSSKATEKEIVKAYRRKALKCHPDKNPDNPKAAEQFHELSNALEVLTDPSAKAAYDNLLRAKKITEQRNRELDSKRKKLKDDLEAREKRVNYRKADDVQAQQNLLAEIERLRKEGSKLLEQEQAYMREKMKTGMVQEDDSSSDSTEHETPKIKIRWNMRKAEVGGSYDEDDLRALFSRYGQITNVIMSSKKKGSAIIEFECATTMLKLAENEHGTSTNPLTVTWLSGKPLSLKSSHTLAPKNPPQSASLFAPSIPAFSFASSSMVNSGNTRDYESLVLMKLRQAEERKRLIEQMQKEDEEEEAKNKKK